MKAIICSAAGGPEVLVMQDIPAPKPTAEQLLIKVHAAGINRADILQRKGKYSPPSGESDILGLEIAGEVIGWGEKVVGYTKGQRVFGLVAGGGYAEYCVLDHCMAIPMPDSWDFTFAAAIPEAFLTAHQTIVELGELKAQETILIHAGGSGVGTVAIQMAKLIGAMIFITAGSDEKIKQAIHLGANAGFNYKTQDFMTEILAATSQLGVDVIEDFIGGKYFPQHIRLLKAGGRLIQVALMGGRQCEIDLLPIVQQHLQIKGSILRHRTLAYKRALNKRFQQHWLSALMHQEVKPIIAKVFPLAEIACAHRYLEANLNFGKIVITMPS